ncbi:TetR/AcrR family transcriptional regulator [Mariprofundus erugo]|uniref:TetR/AcrR family transcriptional regulator n=1 Tax=Mariprofundus erugo TaxID=2528639 RepID=UPI0010FD3FF0|nr:TetR/AcrR family transcriptional regulator [Mariprofundus erugo]TLS75093.1 TetR/AcrR family transcriptional regulator [Mariprofundus erugo]
MTMKQRDSKKRQAILDVAYQLFSTQGFDATSISEITVRAGGSKATIYNHFPSKDELFVECMTSAVEEYLTGAIAQFNISGTDPGIALRRFGASIMSLCSSAEMISMRRLIISEADRSGVGKLFFAKIVALRTHAAELLSRFMASGELRSGNADFAANQLHALLEAELIEPLLLHARDGSPDQIEIEQAADRAVTTFLRAYAPVSQNEEEQGG